jgi:cytochrome c biogenesis protein ResB
MTWFVILGLISLAFILSGCSLAARRIRQYRQETETRRARAFAEMKKIAEKQNVERRMQNTEGLNNYELKIED